MAQITHKALRHTSDAARATTPIILVVDDNYASRIVAKALLEREGYGVVLAEDGAIAVELTRTQVFDLILMDIQMPIMDGLSAARCIIGTAGPNHSTTILAVTAYADKALREATKSIGIAQMLTKPFRIGQIKSAWQRAEPNQQILTEAPAPQMINTPHQAQERLQAVADTNTAPIAMLDMAVVGPLLEAAHASVIGRLYDKFSHSADVLLARIFEELDAARHGNIDAVEQVRRDAHALKGACSNVGFHRASRLAAGLQNAAPADIHALIVQLKPTLERSHQALAAYRKRHLNIASDIPSDIPSGQFAAPKQMR